MPPRFFSDPAQERQSLQRQAIEKPEPRPERPGDGAFRPSRTVFSLRNYEMIQPDIVYT
jgi:hypothetical protein